MFLELLKDFRPAASAAAPVPQEIEQKLSRELRDFYLEVPPGSFAGGFLRTVDSGSILQVFSLVRFPDGGIPEFTEFAPVFSTGFGDLILFDGKGTYVGLNLSRGAIAEMGVRLDYLLQDIQSGFFQKEMLSPAGYAEAIEVHGEPALDECLIRDENGLFRAVSLVDFVSAKLASPKLILN